MSKKKRSKILATLLCATTMAAFYVSPRLVYAESLYYTDDDTVTTNGGGNTAITGIEGLESITFGVAGGQTASVKLTADFDYSGLRAEGAFSAKELFVDVVNAADATDTHNRYSLQNVLGVERTGTGENGSTQIEMVNNQGGMEITNKTIHILDGTAVFSTDENSQYDISFDGSFNSNQGMTVGTNFVLDSTGKISKVNGIDVQGALTTTGTINSMTIGNNQVNGVTMQGSNVTANTITGTDITDGTYHLSQIGGILTEVGEIADKTEGIAEYDPMSGTTFTGNVRASGGLVTGTGTISDTNSHSFTVEQAQNVITSVNDPTSGLAVTNTLANRNRTDIDGLTERVGTAEGHITTLTGNVTDLTGKVETAEGEIDTLQTATTGMNYNSGTGTTFNQVVNATDFKAGDITLTGVAGDLDTAEGKISANETAINGLGTRVATAESEIDVLQTTVGDESSGLVAKTKNLSADGSELTDMDNITTNTFTATSGNIGNIGFSGNNLTNVANISGVNDSVTVAGTAIGNGSFNGVTIADHNTNGSRGATINSVSIYQDSGNDYWVGDVNISKLTSGSGVTVKGIERTDNGTGGHITTIEENLAINSNGEISNHNDSFKVKADGTVTGKDFVIDSNTSLSGVAGDLDTAEGKIDTLQNATTGMSYNSGTGTTFNQVVNATDFKAGDITLKGVAADLDTAEGRINTNEEAISGLGTRVTTAEKDITGLKNKTHGFDSTGETLELTTINSTTGTVGGVTFNGGTATGLNTIGTAADTVTVAGTAISNGSFNGVNIGVDRDSHATFNGVSIYKDANDYIVGDVNISALKGVSGTEIEGIKRTSNTDGGFTTTIEENLAVSTDGTIKQTNGAFAVDAAGAVTGKDFVIDGGTSLSTVAHATTGMTYTPGNTTSEGVTSFDHNVHATNFTTDSADLNKLSETVGDVNSGLVKNVNALNTKTTNLSADGSTLTDMTNIESAAGTIGGMTFATVNGMKTIGSADDTITVAGAEITSNSFNNVEIYQKDENSHYFVGDVDVSALQSGSAEITNKLRGITYSSPDPDDLNNYTMTFAEHFSVSTSGEFTFKDGTGKEYHLDDLINTVDVGDLDKIKDLAGRVDNLEDKTTGIEFNKETGETTISHMNGTDTDTDGVNDTFTKGDNFFAVNEDGISANGDTFVRGDGQTSGGGTGGGTGTNTSDHFVDGDQTVGGSQFVAGDGNFNGSVSVGAGEDVFIDSNGNDTLDDGEISLSGVNSKVEGISVKVDGIGDVSSVNENIAGDSDDDGTNDLAGAVNNEYQQRVEADNALNERINSIDNRMGELEDRIDKVGAMAAAIANLRTMGYDPAAPTEVAVGIGQYRNETGAALGLFHYPNRDFMLSLSVSTSGDEVMGGIGATWKFGRKSPEKVAAEKAEKAREAKLQKAEAIKEAARLKKIEAQQERHAKLAAQKTATK